MKNETVTWEAYSNYLLLEMDQKEKLLRMEKELLGENIQFFKTDGRDSIKVSFWTNDSFNINKYYYYNNINIGYLILIRRSMNIGQL